MDVLDLSTEEQSNSGAKLKLKHPKTGGVLTHLDDDGKEAEMFLLLKGPDSPEYRREFAIVRNRASDRGEGFVPSPADVETSKENDSTMLAKLCVGGAVFMNDAWLDVDSFEKAYNLFYNVAPFRAQALAFLQDLGNFVKPNDKA